MNISAYVKYLNSSHSFDPVTKFGLVFDKYLRKPVINVFHT